MNWECRKAGRRSMTARRFIIALISMMMTRRFAISGTLSQSPRDWQTGPWAWRRLRHFFFLHVGEHVFVNLDLAFGLHRLLRRGKVIVKYLVFAFSQRGLHQGIALLGKLCQVGFRAFVNTEHEVVAI